jgi:ribosomal-protein-alanine N-acetyltransferase
MRLPEAFETPRLRLREVLLADADALYAGYTTDPEVTRFLTWTPHRAPGDTEAYLRLCLTARAEGRANTYLLTRREDGAILGAFDLRREAPFRFGFGYVLARRYWRQGHMSEALGEVLRWCRAQPEIWRVWAFCDSDNIASARTMEKAGMAFEGVLKRWFLHPNLSPHPRDCRAYAWCRERATSPDPPALGP